MADLSILEIAKNVFYVENALPRHREIVYALENSNTSPEFQKIVPNVWENWVHGNPETKLNEDGSVNINFEIRTDPEAWAGGQKFIDWDFTINDSNSLWPRIDVGADYSLAHAEASSFIEMIDGPYKKSLNLWSKASGVPTPEKWISKNYTIKKYRVGGNIGEHPDRNLDNPQDTMDWTALIYLTDDYAGGELKFKNLNLSMKPSAGSILFFPCDEWHSADAVLSGNKTFIFMYIHSKYGISTSIKEFSYPTVQAIGV